MTSISLPCWGRSSVSSRSSCSTSNTLAHVILLVSLVAAWAFIIVGILLKPQMTLRTYVDLTVMGIISSFVIGCLIYNLLRPGNAKMPLPLPREVTRNGPTHETLAQPSSSAPSVISSFEQWSQLPLELQVKILDYLSLRDLAKNSLVSQAHFAAVNNSILSRACHFGFIVQSETDKFAEAWNYLREFLRQVRACFIEKKYAALKGFNPTLRGIDRLESLANSLDQLTNEEIDALYMGIAVYECRLGKNVLFRNAFPTYRHLTQCLLKLVRQGRIKQTLKIDAPADRVADYMALLFASISGDADIVELLLKIGVDPNAICLGGEMPFHAATRMWHYEVVELFLDAGADVNKLDEDNKSALIHARLGVKGKNLSPREKIAQQRIIKLLLAKGAKWFEESTDTQEN